MKRYLAVDFGSTYTKAALVDLGTARVEATAKAPSSVGTDVNIGLNEALDRLAAQAGVDVAQIPAVASSSAAGGLRVAVVGLVPELSLEAARRAALGAGAKIVRAHGYKITAEDVRLLVADAPDILLLVGGTDGGDEEVVIHNAGAVADSALASMIILAGNRVAMPRCREMLAAKGKEIIVTENLLPTLETVNVGPVFGIIRELFMTRIIHAKGIDQAQRRFQSGIIPTPAAVLRGAELLSGGTKEEPGLGTMVVVDVGGATTDIHSISPGEPADASIVLKGLVEPYAKRTVEGDLGLRINAPTIVERAGRETLMRHLGGTTTDADELSRYVEHVHAQTSYVPSDLESRRIDCALARAAVAIAMRRHAGTMQSVHTTIGKVSVQRGKDLRKIKTVIGVGGIFAFGADPLFALSGVCFDPAQSEALLPEAPEFWVDHQYILYGIGLLADIDPTAAVRLGKRHLLALNDQGSNQKWGRA